MCTPLQTILCMGLMLPRLENICDVTQSLSRSLNRRFPSSALRGRRRRCQSVPRLPSQLSTAPTRPPTRADCTGSTRCAACRDLQQNNCTCTVVFKQTRCSMLVRHSPVSSRLSWCGFNSRASRWKRIRSAFFNVGSPASTPSMVITQHLHNDKQSTSPKDV